MSTLFGDFPSNAYVIKVCFCGFGALALLIICGYHLIASVAHLLSKRKYDAHIIFSILALIFAALSGIASFTDLIEKSGCNLMLKARPLLYSCFKTMLYLTLIGRLWVLFTGSFKQIYSKKALKLYSLFLVILRVASVAHRYTQIKFCYSADNGYPYCSVKVPHLDYGGIIALLSDVIIGAINIILFSKPLCKMYAVHGRVYYKIVVIRACIVSILAHLTTLGAYVAIFSGAALEISLVSDLIISSICVISLYRWNWFCTNWMIPNWKEYKKHSGRTMAGRRQPKSKDDVVELSIDEKTKKCPNQQRDCN